MSDAYVKKHSKININNLERNRYALSLLDEACRTGATDSSVVAIFHNQLLSILADLILKYTRGRSSSVRSETAQVILESILYSIDAALLSLNDPDSSLDMLRNLRLDNVYENGLALVNSVFTESKIIYEEIALGKLTVNNLSYNSAIDKDLPLFFEKYDPVFKAHDHMASMDYPLFCDDMSLQGIFYIHQYVKKLHLENHFCLLFPPEAVRHLLSSYSQTYMIDSQDALINIFEIVLTNSIFAVLSGQSPDQLDISPDKYDGLVKSLKYLNREQYSSQIGGAIEEVLDFLHIEHALAREYARNIEAVLIPRIENALLHGCLSNIAILENTRVYSPEILYQEGPRMDDVNFRDLFADLMACCSVHEKIAIIKARVRSFTDFVDILEAECLYGDEFAALFSTLGDLELSLLGRLVFIEEIREDPQGFSISYSISRDADSGWFKQYIGFLGSLDQKRITSIENLIKLYP